jgi:hypothetical protein
LLILLTIRVEESIPRGSQESVTFNDLCLHLPGHIGGWLTPDGNGKLGGTGNFSALFPELYFK